MCELMFEEMGLGGDTVFLQLNCPWTPLARDVISLENHGVLRELLLENNTSCLHEVAYGIFKLQEQLGSAHLIQTKGAWSCRVGDILRQMRRESGKNVPSQSNSGIDELIILDRTVDLITPMCTQLTYEGLLDEILGLRYGQIRGKGSIGGEVRKVTGLNDDDPIFRETRDKFYGGARKWVNITLKEIQRFRNSDMESADVASLKGFVSELKEKFSKMPLHTSLLERLGGAMQTPMFSARQKLEAEMLDEDVTMEDLYSYLYKGEELHSVLRLLSMYSLIFGGIPKKDYDVLRKDILNTFGYDQINTLHALQKSNIMFKKGDKKRSFFSAGKSLLGLLMQHGEDIDEENPGDIHYAYAGYAPISTRIVQKAAKHELGTIESLLNSIPGQYCVVEQRVNDDGFAADKVYHSTSRGQDRDLDNVFSLKPKRVLVVFIGGVTCAEISTLRFLERKNLVPCKINIATTSIINGDTLLDNLIR